MVLVFVFMYAMYKMMVNEKNEKWLDLMQRVLPSSFVLDWIYRLFCLKYNRLYVMLLISI